MTLAGGCRCGACRYTLDLPGLPATYACHCTDCQTVTGGAVVVQAPVPIGRLAVTGELAVRDHHRADGAITTQRFCLACMTRLFSTGTARPRLALLRAGTLDDSPLLAPIIHMWTRNRQRWFDLPADAEVYEQAIPPERMQTAFAANFAG